MLASTTEGELAGFYGDPGDTEVQHGFIRDTAGSFTTFDVPGTTITQPFGMNEAGVIVGVFYEGTEERGFVRQVSGEIRIVNFPTADSSSPLGLNDTGEFVGFYVDANEHVHSFMATPVEIDDDDDENGEDARDGKDEDDEGGRDDEDDEDDTQGPAISGNAKRQDADTLRRVAFIHDGERFHYFAMPGMQTTVIIGVSPDGKEAVGWYNKSADDFGSPAQSFILDLETNEFTPVLNLVDASTVVFRGASANLRYVTGIAVGGDTFGFIWDRQSGSVEEVRRDDCMQGLGIGAANNSGDVLGYCFVAPDFHLEAWFRNDGQYAPLTVPGAGHVSPLGYNDEGWVAGIWSESLDTPDRGFVGRPEEEESVYSYESIAIPDAYSTQVSGVNNDGRVAGNFVVGDADHRIKGPIFRLSRSKFIGGLS